MTIVLKQAVDGNFYMCVDQHGRQRIGQTNNRIKLQNGEQQSPF